MITIFKKHNVTDGTKCIMAHKDMTERDVLSEEIPSASLLICPFHTLRTFRREITTEKMDITPDQRQEVLEIISKIVYSRNEKEYCTYFQLLKNIKTGMIFSGLKD